MIKILIADDHDIVREGMKGIVARTSDMEVCAEARTAHQVLNLVRDQECDVVILDIKFERGGSGLDVLKELKQERPRLPVLVLSMHPEDQYAVRVIRAGAAGYLTKSSAPKELIKAIRKVFGGGRYISESLAETLASTVGANAEKPIHQTLSNREYEIMCLIALGKTIKEIASELGRSEKTIRTHRDRILVKMHMKKDAEIIRYAMQNQLVD